MKRTGVFFSDCSKSVREAATRLVEAAIANGQLDKSWSWRPFFIRLDGFAVEVDENTSSPEGCSMDEHYAYNGLENLDRW